MLFRSAELTKKREVEKKKQNEHLDKSLAKVKDIEISLTKVANEEGHLYAGVTREEIALELGKKVGVAYTADHIALEKPIKELGTFTIVVSVGEKQSEFTLSIVAENSEESEEKA